MLEVVHHQQTADGIHIISFIPDEEGQIDRQAISAYFGEDFSRTTQDAQKIIVDLSEVITLDSLSLGPLVKTIARDYVIGGRLVLCGLKSPPAQRNLLLTRFDQIFRNCRSCRRRH